MAQAAPRGEQVQVFPPRRGADDPWWARATDNNKLEEIPARGTHLHRYFQNLCCMQTPAGVELTYRVLPRLLDLSENGWDVLRIGFVPLVHELAVDTSVARLRPGPLQIQVGSIPQSFTVTHTGSSISCDELSDDAEAAIRVLAAQRTQIVVFPEAVVPDPVVARIKTTLQDLRASGSSYPQLVLAGTYNRSCGASSTSPYNEAVLLNGRGEELWRQHKVHHYEMQRFEQVRYGLDRIFPGAAGVREDITTTPRHITVCDSPAAGLRVIILICEDLAQEDPVRHIIRAMRANLVFNPVMAGALLKQRNFAKTATDLASDPGTTTIVANSGALPTAEWALHKPKGGPVHPPLGIVALPLAKTKDHTPLHLLSKKKMLAGVQVLLFQCPR